jgi:hypothetical protein
VQQEFTSLLREICAPSTPATEGAAVREDCREGAEVSRGHSTGSNEPATKKPDGLTTREGLNLAGSTTMAGRRLALKPNGGAGPRASVAEKECCSILRDCQEPPDADPHVRWCGGREVNPPGYPIRHHHLCVLINIVNWFDTESPYLSDTVCLPGVKLAAGMK